MKKKILFYGNCQLGVLSKMLEIHTPQFNEQYEVLKASNYDLAHIWVEEAGVVAHLCICLELDMDMLLTKQ